MTATRRQTVFAGLDQPGAWPPTPRALRPERLEQGLDSLPGVAAATQRQARQARARRRWPTCSSTGRAGTRPRLTSWRSPRCAASEEVDRRRRVLNVEKRPMRGRRRTRDRRAGRRRHRRRSASPGSTSRGSPTSCSPAPQFGCAASLAATASSRARTTSATRRAPPPTSLPSTRRRRRSPRRRVRRVVERCASASDADLRTRCRPSCASARGWR